jgi:hypothetical protein
MAFGSGPLSRVLLWAPRRLALWVGSNPLRAAGGLGALVAGWVILASLSPGLGPTADLAGVTGERLWRFARARPAYPAAVLVGLGSLLLLR